jgi:hypothetical protein
MRRTIVVLMIVFAICSSLPAQEAESLLGQGAELGFIWALDAKGYSIQNTIGIGYGAHFSLLIKNISTSFGWAGVMNISHPEVNFGYMGLFTQYTFRPNKLFHFSSQLLLGGGATKDYQQEKTNVFDNFGNITGPGFFVVEPGINAEMNFHQKVRLVAGLSYRFVFGLDSTDPLVSITKVNNSDLGGLNINIGVKFGSY